MPVISRATKTPAGPAPKQVRTMHDQTPVLIGQGQFTFRGQPADAPAPLELIEIASRRAAADAGLEDVQISQLDGLGVVGFTIDAPGALAQLPVPRLANPPASLARRLGATPRWNVYTHMGGNSSQQLVNVVCQRIAEGENNLVLVTGAEFGLDRCAPGSTRVCPSTTTPTSPDRRPNGWAIRAAG